MTTADIELRTKAIVLEQVGVSSVIPDCDLINEHLDGAIPGYDSLDRIELCLALEEAFAIDIPDTDLEKFQTVGDVVRYCVSEKEDA